MIRRGLKIYQQLAQFESCRHGIAPGACRHLGLGLGIPVQAVGLADAQRHPRFRGYHKLVFHWLSKCC